MLLFYFEELFISFINNNNKNVVEMFTPTGFTIDLKSNNGPLMPYVPVGIKETKKRRRTVRISSLTMLNTMLPSIRSCVWRHTRNYRPISKLPYIPKLFESIITNKISPHINKWLSECQHGFRAGRSTVTNLALFCNHTYLTQTTEIGQGLERFSKLWRP